MKNVYFVGTPTLAKGLQDFNLIASQCKDLRFYWFCHFVDDHLKVTYPYINFVTGMNDQQLRKFIKTKMDVFVSCSRFEGFCLPIAEALLSKKNVISYKLDEVFSEFGNHIYYVSCFDVSKMKNKIIKILAEPTDPIHLEVAKKYVNDQFSPEKVTERLFLIIDDIKNNQRV